MTLARTSGPLEVELSSQRMKEAGLAAPRRFDAPARRSSGFLVIVLGSALVVWLGWRQRNELYLSAETGLGYALGIAGLGAMLLLLLYSVRKRMRLMRSVGNIKLWFQAHMILGIAGPLAILFHANFHLGSLNSTVALLSTLLVASSGVVGRFLYIRIHAGLSGRRLCLQELRQGSGASRRALRAAAAAAPLLFRQLEEFESFALAANHGALRASCRLLVLGPRTRRAHRAMLRALNHTAGMSDRRAELSGVRRDAAHAIGAHLRAVRRVAAFSAYERLFALWHALHLPLCFLLFGAAVVHVLAVHMY